MKHRKLSLFLVPLFLIACSNNENQDVVIIKDKNRTYESFGIIPANKVKDILESFTNRTKLDVKYIEMQYDLGIYNLGKVYVDVVRDNNPEYDCAEVTVDIFLSNKYICSLGNSKYMFNVYADGDKSYSLDDAYSNKIINDDIVEQIISNAKANKIYNFDRTSYSQ